MGRGEESFFFFKQWSFFGAVGKLSARCFRSDTPLIYADTHWDEGWYE